MDLFDEVQRVAAALDAAKIDYAICGGIALAIHGFPRATQDIDLMARPEDIPSLTRAVATCGFTIAALPMTFATSGVTIQRLTKILDGKRMLTLDVLHADEPRRAVFDARTEITHESGKLWVVSRQGLITLKLVAGRPQDVADIARLEEVGHGPDDA